MDRSLKEIFTGMNAFKQEVVAEMTALRQEITTIRQETTAIRQETATLRQETIAHRRETTELGQELRADIRRMLDFPDTAE